MQDLREEKLALLFIVNKFLWFEIAVSEKKKEHDVVAYTSVKSNIVDFYFFLH